MRKTVAAECIYSIDHLPTQKFRWGVKELTRALGNNLKIHRASGAAQGDCDERGNKEKSAVSFCRWQHWSQMCFTALI